MQSISQCGQQFHFDAIIIGSGLAGLSFALQLSKHRPQAKIALITKAKLTDSNSHYAQGGIAAAHSKDDSIDKHMHDTQRAGDNICYPPAVEQIIASAPDAIKFLLDHGVNFDQNNNDFALAREGGHSERRVFHHGDQTGKYIIAALLEKISQLKNIQLFENHCAVNLITQQAAHQPQSQKEVLGSYVLDENLGLIHTMCSNVVILACGGAGKTYRYTSNPEVATGDGVAMAFRAGARVGNMEFYQFHPTLLYHSTINNFLISEAVRGEGAYLRNVDTGERFMQRYAPEQMELATRDIVARAIFSEIEHSSHNYVQLDIRHQSREFLQQHFPAIFEKLLSIGIDMSEDLIPVVPAAHYQCGGIVTDCQGHTDLSRLYAIGETAFTGLHGANRLASNSLLEAVVMGTQASEYCLDDFDRTVEPYEAINNWNSQSVINLRRASQINAHWRGLRGEMTSYAGIVRTEEGLRDQLELILTRKKIVEDYYWHHTITRDLIELRNIILNAELIVRSALRRQESRGGHYREDFPEKLALATENIISSDLNTAIVQENK